MPISFKDPFQSQTSHLKLIILRSWILIATLPLRDFILKKCRKKDLLILVSVFFPSLSVLE